MTERVVKCNYQETNHCRVDGEWDQLHNRHQLTDHYLQDQRDRQARGEWTCPPRVPHSIRIVSWNVHMGRDCDMKPHLAAMLQVLQSTDADILCLQEFPSDLHPSLPRTHSLPTADSWIPLDQISTDTGGFEKEEWWVALQAAGWVHGLCHLNTQMNVPLCLGNAIFSRYPFVGGARSQYLPTKRPAKDDRRSLMEVVVQPFPQAPPLHVATTHLDVFDNSGLTRQMQWDHILDQVHQSHPTHAFQILSGDMNSITPHSLSPGKAQYIRQMDKHRHVHCQYHPLDAQEQAVKEGRSALVNCFAHDTSSRLCVEDPTRPGQVKPLEAPCATVWSGTAVDYFLVSQDFLSSSPSPSWRVDGLHVLATEASDHLPLVLDIVPTHTGSE